MKPGKYTLLRILFLQKQNCLWFALIFLLMCLTGALQTGIAWHLGGVVDAGVSGDMPLMYRQGLRMGLLVDDLFHGAAVPICPPADLSDHSGGRFRVL